MIRYFALPLFIAFSIIACQNGSTSLKIKGTSDLDNGSKIFHIKADANNQPQVMDTPNRF